MQADGAAHAAVAQGGQEQTDSGLCMHAHTKTNTHSMRNTQWDTGQHSMRNPTSLIQGKMLTRITCHGCNSASVRVEVFADLALPVAPAEHAVELKAGGKAACAGAVGEAAASAHHDIVGKQPQSSHHSDLSSKESGKLWQDSDGSLNLERMIDRWLEEEKMNGSEQYFCDVCGCKQEKHSDTNN